MITGALITNFLKENSEKLRKTIHKSPPSPWPDSSSIKIDVCLDTSKRVFLLQRLLWRVSLCLARRLLQTLWLSLHALPRLWCEFLPFIYFCAISHSYACARIIHMQLIASIKNIGVAIEGSGKETDMFDHARHNAGILEVVHTQLRPFFARILEIVPMNRGLVRTGLGS